MAAAAGARRRGRALRWSLLALFGVAVVLLVWTLIAALAAKSRLEDARADLIALRASSAIDREDIEARLQRDLERTRSARDWLHQPGPRLVASIPLLGRSLVAERVIADASAAAVEAGLVASEHSDELGQAGHIDLDRLATTQTDLAAQADRLAPLLDRLANLKTALVPGAVSSAIRDAQDALLGLDADLARGADLAGALGGILGDDGPRKVLVALENNAELRGTGGLISTYAVGTARDGVLDLEPFTDVEKVASAPHDARKVPAPRTYTEHYGPYLGNTTIWKNVNFDPDVPTSAQVLAEIADRSTGERPDVIILLDVPAMAGIVGATGPVTVDGKSLNAEQLTKALLVDQYGNRADTLEAQAERRHRLEEAATLSVQRLTTARASLRLIRTLAHLTAGRHIALWSARPDEQAALESARVAGSVETSNDIAMVTVTNLGDSPGQQGRTGSGNKLDYYAERQVSVRVTVHEEFAHVVQTLTLRNRAPTGLSSYVEGPKNPGRLHELITFSAATDAAFNSFKRDGVDTPIITDEEHGYRRLSLVADLERGQSATWELTYDVPVADGIYRLDLIPQPVAREATLDLEIVGANSHRLDRAGTGVRPTGGRIVIEGPWETVHRVAVQRHERHGWEAFKHAVSEFWTEPIG